jgi:hypothetical protein
LSGGEYQFYSASTANAQQMKMKTKAAGRGQASGRLVGLIAVTSERRAAMYSLLITLGFRTTRMACSPFAY